MNNEGEESLLSKKNIKINIDSIKLKLTSAEITLYINHFEIKQQNKNISISIKYKDITFNAIEKPKKMVIVCDGKKYNIINIYLNTEEETTEFFNFFCDSIKNNNSENDIELDEEIDRENLLEEWEKKIDFKVGNFGMDKNEDEEECYQDEKINKNKKSKNEINDKLNEEYEEYNYENTIDKINFK